ncbi:MAG: beta-lactamase family protein [Thermoanaerobaculia bacterium]|nr:beta-lactamase family protein [Thermoanaerobaculia bacterium]
MSRSLLVLVTCIGFASNGLLAAEEIGERFASMSDAIEDREYRRIEAVLVERSGDIVFERYFRRSSADSRIDARSAGKSITALAVGIAIDDGVIDGVSAPVFDYFDDRKPIVDDGTVKRSTTIEDLLTMSSALDCDDWQDSPGNEERMYDTKDWTRFALDIPLDSDYERDQTGRGRYSYCTAGVFLLGRIVEQAVGTPFDLFVQQRLFDPLGIEDPKWTRAPNGEVQTGGQLSLRARDFAAIGRLVLNGGEYGGKRLISSGWLRQTLRPLRQATPADAYGYLWWLRGFRYGDQFRGAAYMSGNGGNKVVLFPDLDTVVVILSTNYNRRNMHQQTTELIEKYILPALRSEQD